MNDGQRHLASNLTNTEVRGNSIPLSVKLHEKEHGSGLSLQRENNQRRDERLWPNTLPPGLGDGSIPSIHCPVRHPTADRTFGVVGTDDSGYSQESYRDRSPLNSNREALDPEQEEADVLNEIFFASYRRR